MTRALRLVLVLVGATSVACSSILGDFTVGGSAGDDGGSPDATFDGTGTPDATSSGSDTAPPPQDGNVGPHDSGAPVDSSGDVSCPSTETACPAGCVDLTSSSTNCGMCGHDCGGAGCMNSACLPQTLVSGIDAPTGFTIDSTSIYFAVDNIIKSCALKGCATGTTQLNAYTNPGVLAVVNGNLTFVGTVEVGNHPTPALYSCALPTCASPVTIQPGDIPAQFLQSVVVGNDLYFYWEASGGTPQTSTIDHCVGVTSTGSGCQSLVSVASQQAAPIAADGANVYFSALQADAGYLPVGIASCPGGSACTNPTPLISGMDAVTTPIPTHMVAYSGVLYFVGSRDIGTGGTLYSCQTMGCVTAASLDTSDFGITSLAVDSSGIYFTGTQGSNSGVFRCPLAGCGPGGPVPVVGQQSSPSSVLTDAKFVYWVNVGADGGVGSSSILRVAK